MRDIVVSVCCLAYNHEKYLRQCLDGFVMQETDFPFEVIVHDDASEDGTQDIIREYAEKHPELFVPVFQTQNQHRLGKRLPQIYQEFIYPAVRGRYIAYCEGDDFWTDPRKLRKQVEALEAHPECHMCVHKVRTTDESGCEREETYPERCPSRPVVPCDEFIDGLADVSFFHTSSFLCRTEDVRSMCRDFLSRNPDVYVADVPLLLYFGQLGDNYYLDDEMSCYRRNSVGSWTESQKESTARDIAFKKDIIRLYESFDGFTGRRYASACRRQITLIRAKIAEIEGDFAELGKPEYRAYVSCRSLRFRMRVRLASILRG